MTRRIEAELVTHLPTIAQVMLEEDFHQYADGHDSNEDEEAGTDEQADDEPEADEDQYDVRQVRIHSVKLDSRKVSGQPQEGPGRRHEQVSAFKLPVWVNPRTNVDALAPYELLIDSGSELSLISAKAAHKIVPNAIWHPARPIELRGFDDGEPQRTRAVLQIPIVFQCFEGLRTEMCEFHVVERCSGWLLGVDNMRQVGLVCNPVTWLAEFVKGKKQQAQLLSPMGFGG
ncbi:hypothetical protein CF335_g9106 [Tilletia laevis]|nr:hypothetical protein CF335_g9106 [Tilletia laevis]